MFWKRTRAPLRSSDPSWPFDQGRDVAAMTVRCVLEGDPVLFVAHDIDDHGWQFLDGREPVIEEARAVSMASALDRDPSLRAVADLPPGWTAWRRRVGDEWTREPNPRLASEGDP